MIVPDKVREYLETNPQLAELIRTNPIAFFGWHVIYPKQAEIIRTWLRKHPKITVISGFKRTSKTSIGSYLGCAWLMGALDRNWPGAKAMGIEKSHIWKRKHSSERVGLIGGKNFDHIDKVLLAQYRSLLPPSYIKSWFSQAHKSINLLDNSYSVVRTYDQDLESWKSGAYSFIHLDEEPPHGVLMECLERTRTTKGRIIITVALDDADLSYIPEACDNPLKVFGTEDFMHVQLGVEDVPDLIYPPEEKKAVYAKYDGTPMENAVRKGSFAFCGGKWWANFNPEVHVIKPFSIPSHWKKYRFVDAGFNAPTACSWIAVHDREPIIFLYRELCKKGLIISQRCKEIVEMSGNKLEREDGIWVEQEMGEKFELTALDYHEFKTDNITGDGLDFEYVKSGLNVQPSTTLGQEARRQLIEKFLWVDPEEIHIETGKKGAPRIYFFDTCINTIRQAKKKNVKREATERSGISERKIQNRDDDNLDTVEYGACELRWMIDNRNIL